MNHDALIRLIAPVTDEEAARLVSPQARSDLAERITAMAFDAAPERSRRRPLLLVGVPLAAAATAAAVVAAMSAGSSGRRGNDPRVAVSLTPSEPGTRAPGNVRLAALSFSTQGRYLVVRVKDPLADPQRYRREFAEHGMNITLKLVPASPTVVGTVVMSDLPPSVKTISAEGKCYSGGGACPVGVRIPLGFHGNGAIVFGRAARPGEPYASTNSAFAPGEALHCVDVRGRTVDQALAMLTRHKVTVARWHYEEMRGGAPYGVDGKDRGRIPGDWYVSDADPYAPGQVRLWVRPDRPGHGEGEAYYRRLMAGCPR